MQYTESLGFLNRALASSAIFAVLGRFVSVTGRSSLQKHPSLELSI